MTSYSINMEVNIA